MATDVMQTASTLSGSPWPTGEVSGNVFQIAILNNMLPKGYKFEAYENAHKGSDYDSKSGKRKKKVAD